MTVSLRVVLDQIADVVDADTAEASTQIARALVATAPRGCEVSAIVPAGGDEPLQRAVEGIQNVNTAALSRSKLLAAWQIGVVRGSGRGLVHAPTLFAPLAKHDRANEHDQTIVTIWDLTPWDEPNRSWQRGMLRRAEKHADAIVVPTHAMIEPLAQIAPKLANRIRVIPGAAPAGFTVPADAVGRRREFGVPDDAIVIAGGGCDDAALAAAFAAVSALGRDVTAVVLDVHEDRRAVVADLAAASGIGEDKVRCLGSLAAADRAAVLESARVVVAPSRRMAFPWRVVEALALGLPVVAVDSAMHREILLDGGLLVSSEDLADALNGALDSDDARHRLSVVSRDRGRAFSWRDHAERVWALHAEL